MLQNNTVYTDISLMYDTMLHIKPAEKNEKMTDGLSVLFPIVYDMYHDFNLILGLIVSILPYKPKNIVFQKNVHSSLIDTLHVFFLDSNYIFLEKNNYCSFSSIKMFTPDKNISSIIEKLKHVAEEFDAPTIHMNIQTDPSDNTVHTINIKDTPFFHLLSLLVKSDSITVDNFILLNICKHFIPPNVDIHNKNHK